LEDVEDRDAAQAIQSKEIFLREQDLIPDKEREFEVPDDSLEYEGLVGFMLLDKTRGEIGTIEEVLEMPQQEMALLKFNGREILIPLNTQFIVEIDEIKRQVMMDLPEGLLDV
jgi:16S rRNA processing protein RimM